MSGAYSFGDSDIARERLALLADAFEAPTRALLRDLPPGDRRYVLDLGCGPGHTTALLIERFPGSYVTGLDASAVMVAEARERVPEAFFTVADITAPLLLPAHVSYARLLLGHLLDPLGALGRWAKALRPGGIVVCEEPARYRIDDPWFARYEETVTGVVAARGAHLWAGDLLGAVTPPDCERVLDRVVEHPVPVARAAGMFWRNAVAWRDEAPTADELIDHFRAREIEQDGGNVTWEIRQVVWVKTRE